MARRQLAQRQVTDVVIPQDKTAEGLSSLAGTAESLMELERKKDLANMNNFAADAQLQMLDTTNKWRIANQADPANPEAIGKLHADYDKILGQYNDQVSLLSRGDWVKLSNRLKGQYQLDNAEWGQKQAVVNIKNATNSGIEKNQQIFRNLGRSFDYNKLKNSYQNSREVLEVSATKIIGKAETEKLLENYHRDSMKSFIWGAAESDPDKAELLLNRQDIQNNIESQEDIDTLRAIVKKNKDIKNKGIVQAQNDAEDKMLNNYILDSSKVDIMTVNKALATKQIRPEFANYMRKNILSSENVEAKTQSKTFNSIAESMVDISKNLNDIRLEMLKKNAAGELSNSDFQVLNTFLQARKPENIDKFLPKQTWFQRLFSNGKDAGLRQEIITDMFKQYMQRINEGDDPAKAASEIISNHLDSHLVEQLNKPSRQYATNPQSKQRVYSEDGGITWHDEKTGEVIK